MLRSVISMLIQPPAQRAANGRRLSLAAGDADDAIDPLELGQLDGDHALVERRLHRRAGGVEEAQADVADGAARR